VIELVALALQASAPETATPAYFACVRTTAARLAASREAADVVAEGAIYACRDLIRAAALEQLPPLPPPRGRRGAAPAPPPEPRELDGPLIQDIELGLAAEARGAAILIILEDKVRRTDARNR
jgi:hypothetical protein